MYTRNHLLISLAVGVALVVSPLAGDTHPAVVVGVCAVAGTSIDLDHFLIARYRTGSWDAVRRILDRPRRLFLDQSELFEEGEVGLLHRLLSHALLGGAAVTTLAVLSESAAGALGAVVTTDLALVVAVAVYAHVVADLVADVSNVERVVKKSG